MADTRRARRSPCAHRVLSAVHARLAVDDRPHSHRWEPAAIAPALRAVVRELDPDQPLARVAPLDELIDIQTAARRFNTWLLGAFGAAAIALTAIGLYSLLAYLVALRRHEMAVRLAISPYHVLRLIVRHVLLVVGLGISLGLAGALTTARSMRGLLFGIEPWDPLSQIATIVALGLVAVAAAWIPTRRAMRVDPAIVPERKSSISRAVLLVACQP